MPGTGTGFPGRGEWAPGGRGTDTRLFGAAGIEGTRALAASRGAGASLANPPREARPQACSRLKSADGGGGASRGARGTGPGRRVRHCAHLLFSAGFPAGRSGGGAPRRRVTAESCGLGGCGVHGGRGAPPGACGESSLRHRRSRERRGRSAAGVVPLSLGLVRGGSRGVVPPERDGQREKLAIPCL